MICCYQRLASASSLLSLSVSDSADMLNKDVSYITSRTCDFIKALTDGNCKVLIIIIINHNNKNSTTRDLWDTSVVQPDSQN